MTSAKGGRHLNEIIKVNHSDLCLVVQMSVFIIVGLLESRDKRTQKG